MADEPLPDLRETILRRVDLLADETRRTLAVGSVLGRVFDISVLGAMTQLDPKVLSGALAEAVAAEVVVNQGDGQYVFSHALVQDALYSGLGATRRVRLHHRAAEAIESLHPDLVAAIAHHHCCALPAGDRNRAVEFACRAGAEAAEHGAHEQAVGHYERALAAARTDAGCCLDPHTEAVLLCQLGDACLKAGAAERATETFRETAAVARALDDGVLLAEAAIGLGGGLDESVGFQLGQVSDDTLDALADARLLLPPDEQVWYALVTARLAAARYDMGEVVQAQALSSEALDIARASGDARAIAVALAMRHTSLSCPDALADRLALDEELARLGPAPSAQPILWRVYDLLECGRLADADAAIDALDNGPLARTQPRTRWFTAHYRAMRAALDGRLDDALHLGDEARDIGTRLGASTVGVSAALQSFFVAREQHALVDVPELLDALAEENPSQSGFAVAAAWARTETGRLDEAREQLAALSPNAFAILARNAGWLASISTLADVCYALDARGEAATLYEQLLPYRDRFIVVSRFLSCHGSVERPLGTLALTFGDLGAADDHFARARRANETLAAPLLVARTDLMRARARNARGDDDGARALLTEVRAAAVANGWTDLAIRAAAELN